MSCVPYYTCELDPDTKKRLKMYLFKNVQNVEAIRNKIITGVWHCAIIKPTLILDPLQVAVAVNKAVVAEKLKSMVTRTVFAEILYNLSLTTNISHSLTRFGIEKDQDLLACFLINAEKDESEDILPQIDGEQCDINDLNNFTNLKEVKHIYKLNHFRNDDVLLDIIISKMVTKSFVSH